MSNEPKLPPWLTNLLTGTFLVLFTWFVTTGKMDAVQENRLTTMEKQIDSKASKESVEGMDKRLIRIEDKLDKALDRRK